MAKNLSVNFLGKELENPFVLASAPPTKDYDSIKKGFEAGWAGAVTKSICLNPLQDKTPRIGHIKKDREVTGSLNYEMGSVHPIDKWYGWITDLKEEFPEKLLYVSLFADNNPEEWKTLTEKFAEMPADGLELNYSCPHSDHNGKGSVIGQNPELCGLLTKTVKQTVGDSLKIMPKLPYICHPNEGLVAKKCIDNGADAIAGINTIAGLCEIDKYTLKPQLNTGGKTTGGGVSYEIIRPFGRLFISQVANNIDWNENPISATGGITKNIDSIVEYLALGANHLQVCTEVMNKGYGVVSDMKENLESYLEETNRTLDSLRGAALKYVTSWDKLDSELKVAEIDPEKCTSCYSCEPYCMYDAIVKSPKDNQLYITDSCEGCGSCYAACPGNAINMVLK